MSEKLKCCHLAAAVEMATVEAVELVETAAVVVEIAAADVAFASAVAV